MAAVNNNDWFGNFIMNYIQIIIGGILAAPFLWGFSINTIFVLIGQPTFWYDTVSSFGLNAPEATGFSAFIN